MYTLHRRYFLQETLQCLPIDNREPILSSCLILLPSCARVVCIPRSRSSQNASEHHTLHKNQSTKVFGLYTGAETPRIMKKTQRGVRSINPPGPPTPDFFGGCSPFVGDVAPFARKVPLPLPLAGLSWLISTPFSPSALLSPPPPPPRPGTENRLLISSLLTFRSLFRSICPSRASPGSCA